MIDELNEAIENYQAKWQAFLAGSHDKALFENLKPTSVGWKVEDVAAFDESFADLRQFCDQVHLKWLNERWVATMLLRDKKLHWDIAVIKLMQRRPNSTDALGLDHVDFYAPTVADAQTLQAQEPGAKATDEVNGLCKWTSLWFAGTEAKLRRETTVDVCIAEMQASNKQILTDAV